MSGLITSDADLVDCINTILNASEQYHMTELAKRSLKTIATVLNNSRETMVFMPTISTLPPPPYQEVSTESA